MSLPNQKYREILFLLLFAKAQGMKEEDATASLVMEQLKVSKSHVVRAFAKAAEMNALLDDLDERIQKVVVSYDFERIQTVEKTALRLGLYEILHDKKLPPKVAISEAIRMTKKFGTPAGAKFVNALLDALYKVQLGEKYDAKEVSTSLLELAQIEKQIDEVIHTLPAQSDGE